MDAVDNEVVMTGLHKLLDADTERNPEAMSKAWDEMLEIWRLTDGEVFTMFDHETDTGTREIILHSIDPVLVRQVQGSYTAREVHHAAKLYRRMLERTRKNPDDG